MSALGWTPQDGDTIHLNPRNKWQAPAGRYIVRKGHGAYWHLHGVTCSEVTRGIPVAHLIAAEVAGTLTPIPASELDSERERIRLQLHSPLLGNRRGPFRRQHDASDLALFKAANEPRLL